MKWDKFFKKAFAPNPTQEVVAQRKDIVDGQEVIVNVYPTKPVKLTQQVKVKTGRKTRSVQDIKLPIAI